MSHGLRKRDLQTLSATRLNDAQLLFEHGRWASAYYLAGYAVELALKACAASQFAADAIPDRKLVQELHTHDLPKLISLAGLQPELKTRQDEDVEFALNWGLAAEWKPESRYELNDESSADYLIYAVSENRHGVLPWIQTFW